MPIFAVTFNVDITEEEQSFLCSALACEKDELSKTLNDYGPAALREYIDMFTAARPLSTATEIRERRLLGLMLTCFKDDPPSPDRVAQLFNMTTSAAKSLLRSVEDKHRLRLEPQRTTNIKAALATVDLKAAPYVMTIRNSLVLERLNRLLATAPDYNTSIRPNGTSSNTFLIDPSAYQYLRGLYPN